MDLIISFVTCIFAIYLGVLLKLAIITAIGAVLVSTGIIKES